jgi:phytoene/squalene synthetase
MSDAICSALQLINFLQDISQDYTENKRIYLPQDELQRFQVTEGDIANQHNSPAVRALLIFQIQRAGKLLQSGSPLGVTLPGRFGLEVRAIVLGGSRILEKLYRRDNPFTRPRLDRTDRLKIAWSALLKGFP